MSLLTIVQGACAEIGVPQPSSVIANADQTVAQMRVLVNREGVALARRYPWQRLRTEHTFTTVASETQFTIATALPDYDRIVPNTIWNRTEREPVYGPLTPEQWQSVKAETVTPVRSWYIIRGGVLLFLPAPAAGQTVAFEYISKNWCQSSGGTGQAAFAADTDVGRLDEELLTMGLIWRFLKAKGLDYSEAFRQYELQLNAVAGADGAKPQLNWSGGQRALMTERIPEGDWPGS